MNNFNDNLNQQTDTSETINKRKKLTRSQVLKLLLSLFIILIFGIALIVIIFGVDKLKGLV